MNKAERIAVEAADMKCLRYIGGYSHRDQTRNGNTEQKLKISNLNVRIQQNKVTGMNVFYIWIQEELPNGFYDIN
jgi:hypothetical protein